MTTKTGHRHRAVEARCRIVGYTGPVAWPENRHAHGGVCFIDVCACGATRKTNSNGNALERGPWRLDLDHEVSR